MSSSDERSKGVQNPLLEKAKQSEMERLYQLIAGLQEDIKEIKLQQSSANTRQTQRVSRNQEEADDEWDDNEAEEYNPNWGRRRVERGEQKDSNINSIKMKIPPFKGRNNADDYLEWERKVELIFECHNYAEEKKVRLAAVEFTDYALVWWDQVIIARRRNGERPISTWAEMKAIMRKRFVPSYYYRDLHQRLQRLTQGSRSVEDYHKEMEMCMIKANIEEDPEATMARFLSGLNKDIADVVELQHYVELEEMVNMAIKVERRTKRSNQRGTYGSTSSNWSPKWPRKNEPPKGQVGVNSNFNKGKTETKGTPNTSFVNSNTKQRDIQCFRCLDLSHIETQCPNMKAVMMRDDGEKESDEEDEYESMPPLEDCSDHEYAHPAEGEALVIQRVLNTQIKEESLEQRENLFHTRCLIGGKRCSLIIDSGSVTNVASTILVDKLGLLCEKHPKPYKLQWLNDSGVINVNKQVLVSFAIGNYEDKVKCDVVPMQAGHLLLGRPWQYDRRVAHDGYRNHYTLHLGGRKITLTPLTPKEVFEDQVRMLKSCNGEKGRDTKKEKEGKEAKSEKDEKQGPMGSEKKEVSKKSYFAKERDVRNALMGLRPIYLLMFKETLLTDTNDQSSLPSGVETLLQEFGDIFQDEIPKGLPPLRGIEHQIDFVPGATIPNRPAYRCNLEETKELQRQVDELLEKGYIRESLSLCGYIPSFGKIRGRILLRRGGMMGIWTKDVTKHIVTMSAMRWKCWRCLMGRLQGPCPRK